MRGIKAELSARYLKRCLRTQDRQELCTHGSAYSKAGEVLLAGPIPDSAIAAMGPTLLGVPGVVVVRRAACVVIDLISELTREDREGAERCETDRVGQGEIEGFGGRRVLRSWRKS